MKDNLEWQVTDLKISKRLKELGVKQKSLFWWNQGFINGISTHNLYNQKGYIKGNHYSAFTVAELGELLPYKIKIEGSWWKLECSKDEKRWTTHYGMLPTDYFTVADTEANARGKMKIYLLENKLI